VQKPIDQQLITDYLLGASSETDTERLDKMSLTDGQFVNQLRVVEDDLVDAYVRGELSGEVLGRFTSHYLVSPRRQEKVKVAQTFITFADQAAASPAPKQVADAASRPGTEIVSRRRFFVMPRFALQWGFAALVLVFLVGAGYLVFENFRLRGEMAKAQSERTTLEKREQELKRELESQRTSDATTQQELAQVRERLTQLAQQESSGGQPRAPVVVAFNLSPQTRGAGQIPTIVVPLEAGSLSLTLDLEAIGFPTYEAMLKNPGSGQALWRSGRLRAIKNGTALRFSVPANVLKSQNYVIELVSFPPTGKTEHAGSYSFRIHRS
jgi:hypothetical protein